MVISHAMTFLHSKLHYQQLKLFLT